MGQDWSFSAFKYNNQNEFVVIYTELEQGICE